ncbi:YciI family protein [Gryllotalpicola protaetiae]|uniref:Transcription initiation protein n=1 Tax=Gryllotalpicola protaetiae TaxID=2419771 RepID=A0A387BWM8_9MICO|nr:YciI family protein [Gryllotalpicola protaetiae]AYG05237.1 transcription initiation protein [Gryllotalpicola protaetiae]
MTKYLISFPSSAMDLALDEWQAAGDAAHAVLDEMRAAGVYVFGGGIDESVAPVLVTGDGEAAEGTYPQTAQLDGGMTVIEVETRADAVKWAAKIAVACRCTQELRAFQYDPLA